MKKWGVYILECADGTYYCGVTNDMDARLSAHNAGKGAKYTRGRRPVKVIASSSFCFSRGEAQTLEAAIKRLPKKRKIPFVRDLPGSKS